MQVLDSDVYGCEASNKAGRDSFEFAVVVHGKYCTFCPTNYVLLSRNISSSSDPPSIDRTGLVLSPTVVANKSISLRCPVTGIPSPQVTWLKDGIPLNLDLNNRLRSEDSGKPLMAPTKIQVWLLHVYFYDVTNFG